MAGEEVLIADGNAADRTGLVALVEKHGLVPSSVDGAAVARERLSGKYFAVAMIDLDLPGGAIDLLEFVKQRSRGTQVLMLTSRKNFDSAVDAFRLGATDVVFKRPEEIPRLEAALEVAIDRYRSTDGGDSEETVRLLDEMTKTLVALGRQVYANEIDSLTETVRVQLNVLFVEDDTAFLKEISGQIQSLPMDAFVEMSGGGALDKVSANAFDIVVVKAGLSDLPGAIAVSAAQQRNPACIALLYTEPGVTGRIERVVEGHTVDTYAPFTGSKHLVERLRQLVDEEHQRRRERKVLQVIGSKHSELLRKYAEVKRRLERRR